LNLTERAIAISQRSRDRFNPDRKKKSRDTMTKFHAIFMNCHSRYLKELKI